MPRPRRSPSLLVFLGLLLLLNLACTSRLISNYRSSFQVISRKAVDQPIITRRRLAPKSRKGETEEGFSACLLIKDDNARLIEWLAYHYHVLPLRHLIIATDPSSRTTPLPILKRWDNATDLEYNLWEDKDYMSERKRIERNARMEQAIKYNNNPALVPIALVELRGLHEERQKFFLAECYKYHKLLNHSWVIHTDTDEFTLFNTIIDDEPTHDQGEDESPLIPNQERHDLPTIGQKTILEVLKEKHLAPCHAMPRLLYVGANATSNDPKITRKRLLGNLPPAFKANTMNFDTLRDLHHHSKGMLERMDKGIQIINGLAKVILDVSRMPLSDLKPENIVSIHRPFEELCPNETHGPKAYSNGIFRVNHYLGSWEAYSSKQDTRRTREAFDGKARTATGGPSFEVLPWLASFIEKVGTEKAQFLLEGAGKLTDPMDEYSVDKGVQEETTCAILFFGLGRSLKDITFPSIKKYVLDANPTCQVFVHTYNTADTNASDMILLANHSNIIIENVAEVRKQYDIEYFRTLFPWRNRGWENFISMDNMISQWHSIARAWQTMENYENSILHKRFDRVGLFRPDVLYTHPIWVDAKSEDAVIPAMMYIDGKMWGGYNDRMFYGKRMYAKLWATERFKSVETYLEWQPTRKNSNKEKGLHSETFVEFLLSELNHIPLTTKDICFNRVRSSGRILRSDCSLLSPPGVIVLGMHRSGTSMLTGLLSEVFGWKVPGKRVSARRTQSQNPLGFYENKDVAPQNDAWLKEQGMSWDAIGLGKFDALLSNSLSDHGENALIEYNDPSNQPWAMEDPRMCLTLSRWLRELEGPAPPVVFIYRNPLDVARSLESPEKHSVPILRGLVLWVLYNREAIRLSSTLCRVITRHDALLNDPMSELKRVKAELSRCSLRKRYARYEELNSFVKPEFQHGISGHEHDVINDSNIDCTVPKYETSASALEHNVYLKAMQVFCDLQSGAAFASDYMWPSLPDLDKVED